MWQQPKDFNKKKKFSISKNYNLYRDFDDVNEIINIIKDPKNNYNELICKNEKVKPYFDIESTTEFSIQNIVNTIKNVIFDLFEIKLIDNQIYILECNRIVKQEFKWSYHVIINDYHFDNVNGAKQFAEYIYKVHSEVDLSVYSNGYQNIRMLNCIKKGENIPFKLVGKKYSDEIFGYCLITNVSTDSIALDMEYFEPEEIFNYNEIEYSELEELLPLIEKDLGTKLIEIKQGKDYWSFNYDHNFKCLFGNNHTQLGHCIKKYKDSFYVYCYSKSCKGLKNKYNTNNKTMIKNTDILKELDMISSNNETKDYNIKHSELVKNTNMSITASIESSLEPFHNFVSKNCKNACLFSECKKEGYIISCENCNFKFPDKHIPLDKLLVPHIFNMLVVNNGEENINNKDTSQVAKKILNYKNLIYTEKKWYLYNEDSGIYETKDDLDILELIEEVAEYMKNDNIEADWHSWIGKVSYKENLVRELKAKSSKIFKTKNIKLDSDNFLLGFDNGVLDLNTEIFRKGLVNEYTTMKCGINYDEKTDSSLAFNFLSEIFPIQEELDYAINKFSLSLEGFNREQMITFAYGVTASNGKSYLMDRMRHIMGDYGGTFPVTLLTNKMKGAGEANSSLIDFNKKRFMGSSEPEAGAKLNTNFVKLLTGDTIKARGLYSEKETEIYPSFKIFTCCNSLPNFDMYDEGIARRISLIEYKTRFCENPKKKNERLLKKYSKKEESELSSSLLKLLIERYFLLKKNNYKYTIPKELEQMRTLYLNDNKDVIKDILLENFEIGDNTDFIKLIEIKKLLKNHSELKDKDVISLIYIIQDTFDGIEFKKDSTINNKSTRNFFAKLKIKETS